MIRKDSFVRWQATTIAHLSYAINLVLSFSVAALGFQITLLLGEKFNPVSWQKCAFSLSLLLLLASVVLGLWSVINRLSDFRATTMAARLREDGEADELIQPYRVLYSKLGERTWGLLWWQLGTFAGGVFFTVLSVSSSISQKLL